MRHGQPKPQVGATSSPASVGAAVTWQSLSPLKLAELSATSSPTYSEETALAGTTRLKPGRCKVEGRGGIGSQGSRSPSTQQDRVPICENYPLMLIPKWFTEVQGRWKLNITEEKGKKYIFGWFLRSQWEENMEKLFHMAGIYFRNFI